jgi:hypothetical protein
MKRQEKIKPAWDQEKKTVRFQEMIFPATDSLEVI